MRLSDLLEPIAYCYTCKKPIFEGDKYAVVQLMQFRKISFKVECEALCHQCGLNVERGVDSIVRKSNENSLSN